MLGTGTATVAILAGCITSSGSEGTHELDPDGVSHPTTDAPIVASASTSLDGRGGSVEADGHVYELDDEFVLVTEYRVVSHDSEWLQRRFQAEHAWRRSTGGEVMEADSNFRQTNDDPPFELDVEQTRNTVEWKLSLADSKTDTQTYVFVSRIKRGTPDSGDRLADMSCSVVFEEDRLLGDSEEQHDSSRRLEYEDDADGRGE